MILFTVHEPERTGGGLIERADTIRFVKEGFCWPALFVPLLWLVYHRMWLVLAAFAAAILAIEGVALATGLPDVYAGLADAALSLAFAALANGARRWTLERNGYREIATVTGKDRETCERKFFAEWTETVAPPRQPAAPPPKQTQARGQAGPVIGGLGGAEA